jgi:hypothetical protein
MAILTARPVGSFVAGIPGAPPADVTGTDDAYVVKSEAAKPRELKITG